MSRARRSGCGVRLEEWRLPAADSGSAGERVLEWCREVVAECRRPFGIDAFDLAVACREAQEGTVQSLRFLRLRPFDLYTETFATRLSALFSREGAPLIIAAALFSWGDAAHEALPASP